MPRLPDLRRITIPSTSTYALTNATLSYGLEMTDKGVKKSMHKNPNLRRGLNTYRGKVTHNGVAAAFGLALIPPGKAIKA